MSSGVDEIEQVLLMKRLFKYPDAKLRGITLYVSRRRTGNQQNLYDCSLGAQSFGHFQPGHVRHAIVQDQAGQIWYRSLQKLDP